MKESILIENAGPLREVNINEIKPFTLFIGQSASGKSTLMKIIALMRYIFKMQNVRSYLKNAEINHSPFRIRMETLLHNGLADFFNAQTHLRYTAEINGNTYVVEYKDKKLKSFGTIRPGDLVFFKEAFVAETRSSIPAILANNTRSSRNTDFGFYFNETYNDFKEATEKIREQALDYLGFKMSVRKSGNEAKRIFIAPTNEGYEPLELRFASSGIQTSAILMTLVRYFSREFSFQDAFQRSVLNYLFDQDRLSQFKPRVDYGNIPKYVHLHIEEPELSLYPAAQCALLNDILSVKREEVAGWGS